MVYVLLISYLVFTFVFSLMGVNSKDATPESYFLANRDLNTTNLFFTILATNFSAFYFMGFAGEAYRIGYSFYVIMALGTALAGMMFLIIGPKIWVLGKKKGYMTPSELVYGESRSRFLSSLFSLVMIIFTLPYLSLQIVGGAYILESLTDGNLSYGLAVLILTIVTIAYVLIGGMQSVVKTDLKQGFLVILLMTIAAILLSNSLGGISEANISVYITKPELFNVEGRDGFYTPQKWFSFLVFWMFCVPMFPQLFIRFYTAIDLPTLNKSAIYYALIPIFISLLPVMIGVWGHIDFPNLQGRDADQILPLMLMKHTSTIFSALVMTGALAAFMSTLDSQLLALSTMLTRDFYMPFVNDKLDLKKEVFIGRIFVVILALIGLLIAWNPFDTIFDMGKMAFSGLAVLFPVAIIVLFIKRYNTKVLSFGIIISLVCLVLFYYKILPEELTVGFETFLIVILISSIFAGISLSKRSSYSALDV